MNVLGNGVVIDFKTLFKEIDAIAKAKINVKDRLLISDRARIMLEPNLLFLDQPDEPIDFDEDVKKLISIAPCYCAKTLNRGLRVADLLHWDSFKQKYHALADEAEYFTKRVIERKQELDYLESVLERVSELAGDSISYLNKQLNDGRKVLADGTYSAIADNSFGIFPELVAFNTGTAAVCSGLGVPPSKVAAIGVVNAYTSRIFDMYFPTRFYPELEQLLQMRGMEISVIQDERRYLGWNDMNVLRTSHMLNNYAAICISKLEILDEILFISIGMFYTDYKGTEIEYLPATEAEHRNFNTEMKTYRGWMGHVNGVLEWKDLPEEAQFYVQKISQLMRVPVIAISTGRANKEMVWDVPKFKPIEEEEKEPILQDLMMAEALAEMAKEEEENKSKIDEQEAKEDEQVVEDFESWDEDEEPRKYVMVNSDDSDEGQSKYM
eukprot:CAMPEP_0204907514 /NCGR_PEP_ID=MMETSP1397-20131031/6649_1 /ASSEMBLY_ACC=CAM_ASM_000891 /TAXON_ID=49980 /ORGANISM="Climacostomum Climacostomum virens, Strain Stock W-24" /LENGTH=437 /DNA_ID=CAMNT_0052076691 /DNA_START=373 /DNA_END=1686 /DNA_ORIENTATION=+